MPIATTFSLVFDKNIDLAAGPATNTVFTARLADGGFAASGERSSSGFDIERFDSDANVVGGFLGLPGEQGTMAQLTNGNLVYAEWGAGSIKYAIKTLAGGEVLALTGTNDPGASDPDVAALAGGGFVIVSRDFNAVDDFDIDIRVYNSAGAELLDFGFADGGRNLDPKVCALADGGFAVAWWKIIAGTFDQEIWLAVYNADGTVRRAPSVFDTGGAVNRNVDIADLAGGEFVMVYEDDGWAGGDDADITLARVSAAGTLVYIEDISDNAQDDIDARITVVDGNTVAVSSGYNAVSAADTDTIVQLIDATNGTTADAALASRNICGGEPLTDDVDFAVVQAYGLGSLAVFHQNVTDNDIDGEALDAVRTQTATDNANYGYVSSNFIDVVNDGGGSDAMYGGEGDDTFHFQVSNVSGVDTISGGGGLRDLMSASR